MFSPNGSALSTKDGRKFDTVEKNKLSYGNSQTDKFNKVHSGEIKKVRCVQFRDSTSSVASVSVDSLPTTTRSTRAETIANDDNMLLDTSFGQRKPQATTSETPPNADD
ncbi:hypothetical protein SK128_004494, partial [Halocaridina rubra]